jgi:hypothetical protein
VLVGEAFSLAAGLAKAFQLDRRPDQTRCLSCFGTVTLRNTSFSTAPQPSPSLFHHLQGAVRGTSDLSNGTTGWPQNNAMNSHGVASIQTPRHPLLVEMPTICITLVGSVAAFPVSM